MITVTIIRDTPEGPKKIHDLNEAASVLLDVAAAIESGDQNVRPSDYHTLEYRDTNGRRVK